VTGAVADDWACAALVLAAVDGAAAPVEGAAAVSVSLAAKVCGATEEPPLALRPAVMITDVYDMVVLVLLAAVMMHARFSAGTQVQLQSRATTSFAPHKLHFSLHNGLSVVANKRPATS